MAGTGVPDWLTVADRPVRLRSQQAEPFVTTPIRAWRPWPADVLQHLRDDAQFHATRAFAETSLALTAGCATPWGAKPGCGRPFSGICWWKYCWMPR